MNFDFSALNFETIDSNINAYPDIFLNQNGVTITRRCLRTWAIPPLFCVCWMRKGYLRSVQLNRRASSSSREGTERCCYYLQQELAPSCEDWIPGKRYKVRGFWVADAKTMCFDLNEGVQEDFRPVTPSNDAE